MPYLEHILLAEEDVEDAFLIQLALKQAGLENPVEVLASDDQVIDYLSHTGQFAARPASPLPMAIILALRLPLKNDFNTLRWIRRHPELRRIPVTVLSGLEYANERAIAHDLGAQCYKVKPLVFRELVSIAREIRESCLQPIDHPAAA